MQAVHRLETIAADFVHALDRKQKQYLSQLLGVSPRSLDRLQTGWSKWHRAFTFSMRDPGGSLRGIRFRGADARKWSLRGGREGLFLPVNVPINDVLLICEGPTDTAALLDLNFDVVGRPSCNGGAQMLVDLVCDWTPSTVAIIADADIPGQRGAQSLAAQLVGYVPNSVRIVTPPAKDAREWVRQGATRLDILDAIDAAPALQLGYGVKGGAL
jgi:hypothetical protein